MKSKMSRSDVMRRAWSIYRNCAQYRFRFGLALSRAWEIYRADVKAAEARAKAEALRLENARAMNSRTAMGRGVDCDSYIAGLVSEYSNSPRGTYFGD